LIFGGYDRARFTPNDIVFQMSPDVGRELTVAVQSITTKMQEAAASVELLPTRFIAALDSLEPNIWLPIDACTLFEETFGLQWNDTVGYYFINETLHESLLKQNPVINFTLGNAVSGPGTNISIPYGAFDLQLSYPIVENVVRYFPLKRASFATQVSVLADWKFLLCGLCADPCI
jgi:hypothetical protein